MHIRPPESALGREVVVSSRAYSGCCRGGGTSGQLPGLEAGASSRLWQDGANGLPGCWDKAFEGCGGILISEVTVFCVAHLATHCRGSLAVFFHCCCQKLLNSSGGLLSPVRAYVGIFCDTQESASPSRYFPSWLMDTQDWSLKSNFNKLG